MSDTNYPTPQSADFRAQREYIKKLREQDFDYSLTIAGAFVRGMREIGYKSSATALDELIDNSIQAEARDVDIFWPHGEAKPSAIAVADNGHGMEPDMIRVSTIWGGTHRENERTGFGRFGYGLPSASVHLGRRFTVYSRVAGDDWYAVTVDVDDISEGRYTVNGKIIVPEVKPASLPTWVQEHLDDLYGEDGLQHGTVVVIEKLDNLHPRTAKSLRTFLLEKIGVTYRNFLTQVTIRVDDEEAEPTDPLFLTPGYRYYDLDEDRAEALEPLSFEVKDSETGKPKGLVKVRFSIMPPTFARPPDAKLNAKSRKNNARFHILDENNGLIILRNGRQIDVLTGRKKDYLGYINNDDRYWGVEIDFPASLDEEFHITTTKQQVVMSDRMWDLLKQHGVFLAIREMRKRYDEATAKLKERTDPDQKRASEEAMERSAPFKTTPPASPTDVQKMEEEGFQEELRRRAENSGVPAPLIEEALRSELKTRKYRVAEESLPGAPFFRVLPVGGQRVLYINTAHRFYTDVYKGPDATARTRAALEVLLFVLGDREIEGTDEAHKFYTVERAQWSNQLSVVLDELDNSIGLTDIPLTEQDDSATDGSGEEREAAAATG